MSKIESFSSRWGLVLAALGMAIGAGNLWRFPRLAGQYGGTFLILWIVFLLIWSIPILLAEFSIGKKHKMGVIGSYTATAGKNYAWAGFFITVCTLGIAFYYSVVTGWALRYLIFSVDQAWLSVSGGETVSAILTEEPGYLELYWAKISNLSMYTVISYMLLTIAAVAVLYKGIQKGLEKANRILIPTLFLLILIIAVMSLSMENGWKGLNYMFTIDVALFGNATVWIEALSQSAWSTGAGWGLMLTISSYSRAKEDVTLNTFIGAFGNNTASLLAGMAILPAVFALSVDEATAISYLQEGNQALTFTIIPKLFATIPGGIWLAVIFFLAFLLAAFSSFLPMIELFIRNLIDAGMTRGRAALTVCIAIILFGLPSAWSLDFFNNQDWVWGIGLIVSGLFMAWAAVKYGLDSFKKDFIDKDSDFKVPPAYFKICLYLVIPLGIILIYWWLSQGYSENPWFDEEGNWNIWDVYSNATVVTQWALVLLLGFILNGWLYKKFIKR
ncbi:MAG: sodium-dependent transporter [Candidatus Cyclobacteriaceae bacterium M2_1C_046]